MSRAACVLDFMALLLPTLVCELQRWILFLWPYRETVTPPKSFLHPTRDFARGEANRAEVPLALVGLPGTGLSSSCCHVWEVIAATFLPGGLSLTRSENENVAASKLVVATCRHSQSGDLSAIIDAVRIRQSLQSD